MSDVALETSGEIRFAVIAHDQGNGGCLATNPDEVAADRGMLVYRLAIHARNETCSDEI